MASLNVRKNLLNLLIVLGILACAMPKHVVAQGISVADIVTEEFLNGISNKAAGDCPNRGFYTRQAFLEAFNSYPEFGSGSSDDDSKREIAAFFAHATHETGYLCFTEEGNKDVYCNSSYIDYPCNPSKSYYGRGPLQLTWNYNYGPAGTDNNFDGLNSPEVVASDPVISFKTALWFWKKNVQPVLSQGFGATISRINSIECNNGDPGSVQDRIDRYNDYCSQFGVDPGDNLSC